MGTRSARATQILHNIIFFIKIVFDRLVIFLIFFFFYRQYGSKFLPRASSHSLAAHAVTLFQCQILHHTHCWRFFWKNIFTRDCKFCTIRDLNHVFNVLFKLVSMSYLFYVPVSHYDYYYFPKFIADYYAAF